ncbi:hypothetical protein [Spiroplasma poulsonii]|uniref:hypothetical protein n=1 Tax=Spiroplasma poulsonii TaxID=2138 RepID=UPI001F4D2400|nr:hypothetical protein [Spiroplasma poulsonii]UNF61670.1 hypothetical protein MNU24_07095 [Spiroplasma poulsonii]
MIILMIKLLLILPRNSNPTCLKRNKNNLILSKRKTHDQNTSNYRTRNQKLLQQVFRSEKNMIMLYLKNQKSQF